MLCLATICNWVKMIQKDAVNLQVCKKLSKFEANFKIFDL